ncbi:hypothetical protein [Negadavirga shengliensis]|uniref:Outer membrane protein beta-barrel domain-containing protein n=1 Tax=Negadavirga shengliensis TaxID=1389218 RepID=A0ABV9SZ43_9BACT
MKNTTILIVVLLNSIAVVQAQNPLSQSVQTEFGIGISTPFLHDGTELNKSANLRSNALSYFADEQGNRKNIGNYGSLIGWSVALAYYRPVKMVNGLMLGTAFRTSLTGSQPQNGGYEEGFFFNFLSLGFAAKYYPFTQNNLFFKADAGLASVFTKNRFLNAQNEQGFFHQFGVGTNISSAMGYSIQPFKNKSKTIDLQLIYQLNATRVEVNGIGNDQWTYSALTLMGAFNF